MRSPITWFIIALVVIGLIGFLIFRNPTARNAVSNTQNELTQSSPTPSPTPQPTASESEVTAVVSMTNNIFKPDTVTIQEGDTVRWENLDEEAHNVTFSDLLISNEVEPGQSYEYAFADAGTYDYECTNHLQTMKGTVIVQESDDDVSPDNIPTPRPTPSPTPAD